MRNSKGRQIAQTVATPNSWASRWRAIRAANRTLILIVLLIQLVACKQGEHGQGSREPGAQVTFKINLADYIYLAEHAEITIDGKLISSVRNGGEESVFLPKGDYRIRVSAKGFEPIEREVYIQDSPTQTFHFILRARR